MSGTFHPVLGGPRTGSSLLSCIMHTLGIPMGQRWCPLPDLTWSPDHYWADAEFADIHSKLLMNATRPPSYGMPAKNPEHWEDYRKLVAKREAVNLAWGYKEVMLPILWPTAITYHTFTIAPLFATRDAAASDASWQARTGLKSLAEATAMLQPFREAVNAIATFYPDALTVDFDTLVTNPIVTVDRIANYFGVSKISARRVLAVAKILPDWKRF